MRIQAGLFLLLHAIASSGAQSVLLTPALIANLSSALDAGWNVNVARVCSQAVTSAAGRINNPSGLLACYNVAALENVTGLFAGDLRLYSVAQSTLPSGSSVQLNIDFGQAGIIQSFTDVPSSTSAPDPEPQNKNAVPAKASGQTGPAVSKPGAAVVARPADNQLPVAPVNNIRPGSPAGVASPQAGINPIVASQLNPPTVQNSVPAAILTGEKSLRDQQTAQLSNSNRPVPVSGNVQDKRQVVRPTATTGSASTNLPLAVTGQEVEKFQFIGRLNVDLANTNPNGLGTLGSLLPKISLIVLNAGQSQPSIDMSGSTRPFLIGIKGSTVPVGTFILPGRILLGADQSVDKAGLFIVSIYTVAFFAMMAGGMVTRQRMRTEYRSDPRYVGR